MTNPILTDLSEAERLALLRSYRCDMVQGYFFSPPLGPEALLAWCRSFEEAEA